MQPADGEQWRMIWDQGSNVKSATYQLGNGELVSGLTNIMGDANKNLLYWTGHEMVSAPWHGNWGWTCG